MTRPQRRRRRRRERTLADRDRYAYHIIIEKIQLKKIS
jgi:hypothetical protein